jgi:NAD(P)-dependent dehydrogenase (short-subunit alcohol dehydrogenase family)
VSRRVLVTGAASGLGKAMTARRLHRRIEST